MKILTNRIKRTVSEDAKKKLADVFDVFLVKSDAPAQGTEEAGEISPVAVPFIDAASAKGKGILACAGRRGAGARCELYLLTEKGSRTEGEIDELARHFEAETGERTEAHVTVSHLTKARLLDIADVPDYILLNLLLFRLGTRGPQRKDRGLSTLNNALYTFVKRADERTAAGKEEYVFLAFRITPDFVLRFDVETFTDLEAFRTREGTLNRRAARQVPYVFGQDKVMRRWLGEKDEGGKKPLLLIRRKTEARSGKRNEVTFLYFDKKEFRESGVGSEKYAASKHAKIVDTLESFNTVYGEYGLAMEFEAFEDLSGSIAPAENNEIIRAALGRFQGISIISTDAGETEKAKTLADAIRGMYHNVEGGDDAIPELPVACCLLPDRGKSRPEAEEGAKDGQGQCSDLRGAIDAGKLNLVLVHEKERDLDDVYSRYPPGLCQHLTYEKIPAAEALTKEKKRELKRLLKKCLLEACAKDDILRRRITLADTSFMPYAWVEFFVEANELETGFSPRVFGVRVDRAGAMTFLDSDCPPREGAERLKAAEAYFRAYAARYDRASSLDYIAFASSGATLNVNFIVKPRGLVVMPSVEEYKDSTVRRTMVRNNDFYNRGGMNGLLGMSVISIPAGAAGGQAHTYYAVGRPNKDFPQAVARAVNFREIIIPSGTGGPDGSDNIIQKLLPMMDAPFVRLGQYSVRPMPLKYLREYVMSTFWQEQVLTAQGHLLMTMS